MSLPLRIQSQVPAEGRTWLDLLRNIAGNVVVGKVHPPRLVTGTPTAASVSFDAMTLSAKEVGAYWNDWSVYVTSSAGQGLTMVIDDKTKTIRITYEFGSTTYGAVRAMITAGSSFNATWYDGPIGGQTEDADIIPETDSGFTIAYTSGGSDLECFSQASKDYVRVIQNCGTNAVKLLYSNSGHASAAQFSQILRAGSAQDDGNGGAVQVVVSSRVTAIGADGAAVRLAITRVEAPEAI